MDRLTWGILGAGNIAKAFAKGVAHSRTGQVLAVGSRDLAKSQKFAQEFGIARAHGSYADLLADPDVQAVYIATPHPMHAEWAIRAARAGKHILCEKPLALNHAQAMAVVEAAATHDVFLMEAFMYRCHPQIARLVELLKGQAIGDLRLIQASFAFHAGFNATGRLFANDLGGGGILDVGCYCTSAARLVAGAATGKDFADPIEFKGVGHLGSTGVDEWAIASLKFPGDIVAQLATGVSMNLDNSLRIFGSEGHIVLPSPWIPSREGGQDTILLHRKGQDKPEEILIQTDQWLYGLEADTVAANIQRRQAPSPAMTWDDTLGNMKTLDQWRESIGLVYESEKPGRVGHILGSQLKVRQEPPMQYARIAGVGKPLSRLVMGVDNQRTAPHAAVMFDDYIERGGNCFDTAYVYGGGQAERLLGSWVKSRALRQDVIILDKGAHTPFCTPEFLTKEFMTSLDRLQMDYVDIYMMHRDNPQVPVGEFIDVLNDHKKAGRMRAFGGSNWSLERIQAANEYAQRKGLAGFSAISNNFSLAEMIDAPWGGCVSCSGKGWREWLIKTQTPVMPWSSQAQGFFARGDAANLAEKELVRCWYSPDNFRRLERARKVARKYNTQSVVIALAYVLGQEFPTFPLIGPRALRETRSSFGALSIALTKQEIRWLNLED